MLIDIKYTSSVEDLDKNNYYYIVDDTFGTDLIVGGMNIHHWFLSRSIAVYNYYKQRGYSEQETIWQIAILCQLACNDMGMIKEDVKYKVSLLKEYPLFTNHIPTLLTYLSFQ